MEQCLPPSELGERLLLVSKWKVYTNKLTAALNAVVATRDNFIFQVWELFTVIWSNEDLPPWRRLRLCI